MKQTGVDALAIAIGTSHGAYKFSSKPTGETLKMERLIEIHKRLPNVHLVMHGSSSVPKDLQDIINQYGGKLKPTWGVPVEEIQLGIKQRRPQDQRGHRQPSGDHRRDPQGVHGEAGRVRSAQLHEARARSHEEGGGASA